MEKTGYFRSANKFNVATNVLSGILFPLSDEKTTMGFFSSLWVTIVWSINVAYVLTMTSGTLYFANLSITDALKRAGSMIALCFELTIPMIYMNIRRNDLKNLIKKYNEILVESSDLKKIIRDTLGPYKKGLQAYTVACFIINTIWKAEPIAKVFHCDEFTYGDFTIPAYFPGEPFGKKIFVAGVTLQILAACLINFGKISIDVYVSHFIAVLTAEYKYVRGELVNALSLENVEQDDVSVVSALRNCVRHHSAVIETGQRLTEILAFHIGSMYLFCILKFCFLAFGFATFESPNVEMVSYFVYAFACVAQIYLMCACIQELFDESTTVTRDAFHENWHARSRAVKRIFCTMEVSNHMECRLSAYGIVDFGVPTLAVILSKSYSFCLLLLKFN